MWSKLRNLFGFGPHQADDHEQNNPNAPPVVSPPHGTLTTGAAAESWQQTDDQLSPASRVAPAQPPSSSLKGKGPDSDDPDNLNSAFSKAWDKVDSMSDEEIAQKYPWSQSASTSGVSPSAAGAIFDSIEKH